jgi:hypothetical protein
MRTLHIDQLRAIGACTEQVERFAKLFGDSVQVTEALAVEHYDKFDWNFAAKLLSDAGRAEYDRVRAGASAEYDRVTASALAEYDRVRAGASAEYQHVRAQAWVEYERVKAQAWAGIYVSEAPILGKFMRWIARVFS